MNPNKDDGVYDKNDQQPVTGADLSNLEGRSQSKPPSDSKQSTEQPDDDSFYNPTGEEVRKSSRARANQALAELSGATPTEEELFSAAGDDATVFKPIKKALRDRKKVLAGGGAAAGVATIVAAGFLLLIPLKMEHIVSNLQNRFMSSSNSAVETETQNMFKNYITTKVLPAYKSCGTTISKDCTPRDFGTNPVGNLYRTWANARLENKLADNYGIEFKYDKTAKVWHLKGPGIQTEGDNIGPDGAGLEQELNGRSKTREAFKTALNTSLENETKWKQVMIRYKAGRLWEEKYGLKRCLIYCGVRDQLGDKVDTKKKAAQIYLVQRVIGPFSESRAAILECMINACDPTKTQPTQAETGTTGEQNGAPESSVSSSIEQEAQQSSAKFVTDSSEELVASVNNIAEKGFQKAFLEAVLTKAGLGAVASQAADAVPIIGAVVSASHVITFASHAGPAVQTLGYISNSSADASLYTNYRTYTDEIHTGHTDITEVGSWNNSLGSGDKSTPGNPQIGGTAGAEGTPLYADLIDNKPPSAQTSLLGSFLPGKASAAGTTADYKCDNGLPVPVGEVVCAEEELGNIGNSALNGVSAFLNSSVISPVTSVANAVSGVAGSVSGFLGGIVAGIPGVGDLVKQLSDVVSQVLNPFFSAAINVLVANPFSTVMSGGRVFDLMAGGADVVGNVFAQTGLGGQALTPQQTADVVNQQQSEAQQNFQSQPLFARMFSTDSQYSLVSKLAMDVPLGSHAAAQSSIANLLNPLSSISHGFGSMLSGKASAAVSAQQDPFGVTQYGYPAGTIPDDPETYWDQHCSDNPSNAYMKDNSWNEAAAATTDPVTGQPRNNTTNPCLLIKASVGSAGGLFDTTLLTQDDLADQNSGANGGGATTPAGVTIDLNNLNKSSVNIACAANTNDAGIQDGYSEGKLVKIRVCAIPNLPSTGEESNGGYGITGANGKAIVNSRVSGAVYAMAAAAKQAGVNLTAGSSFRTMAHQIALQGGGAVAAPPGYSNHQMGLAIDFSVPICDATIGGQCSDPGNPMWDWLHKNAGNFGYKSAVPSEAWHWSPTGN